MPQSKLWNWLLKGGDSFMPTEAKKTTTTTMTATTTHEKIHDLNELIAKKAYELYEKRGCQPGNDAQDWLEAERLVRRSMRQR